MREHINDILEPTPAPGAFSVIYGRYGGRYRNEYDSYEEAVAKVLFLHNGCPDEQYIIRIDGPDGQTLHDHSSPFEDWVPPLPA